MTCANNHMSTAGTPASSRHARAPARAGHRRHRRRRGHRRGDPSRRSSSAHGLRIAFLGFCTVFPVGYEARTARPGLAPLRVRTFYADPDPNFWEPGIEPVITTVPVQEDLDRFRSYDRQRAGQADYLVVACHWGYSSWVEVLQGYELELARDAVDHGADAVVCHHHHSLRGDRAPTAASRSSTGSARSCTTSSRSRRLQRTEPHARRASATAPRWSRTRRSRSFRSAPTPA